MNKIVNGVANDYEFDMLEPQILARWQDPTIEKLQQELDQYKNNWEELKKEMNRSDLSYIETQFVLDKMKELEGE